MACRRCMLWLCVVVLLHAVKLEIVDSDVHPVPEFSRHTVIKPYMYHTRERRHISSTRQQREKRDHIHDLTIGYDINGKDYVLDLQLNRELIPKTYFERYQHNGEHVVNKPTAKDIELCYYHGKLRSVKNSWAAISTCHGLRGVIYDGREMHYLETALDDSDSELDGAYKHILYDHSDYIGNHSCGYGGSPHHFLESQEFNRILRYKRSPETIRGPYNANKQSRYVELVLVVDNKEYKELGENLTKVFHHCKEIANIINALYVPLNIYIALVGVVVWTENDEINLSSNGDSTLTNFLVYRRQRLVKEHPNDNAQLLTRVQFDGGVVGKALKGPICTYEFSGGVSMDHSHVVGLVATTVAHEIGHNFGMEHDTSDCKCPTERCIMAPSSSALSPTQWSSCSLEYLALAFDHGMDYCLRNKPKSLFDGPVCGNGFVEAGEQCDCGLLNHCDNSCCNASTCMLFSNASCATGECCDLSTCKPKKAGSVCRSADHECDLPEYCTGQSEYCPDDVYKMDGETCDRGKAFCYQGSCRTHSDQCRLLWGPTGKSSDLICYSMNIQGNKHGNCGFNRLNQSYLKCSDENKYCGMLHCRHLNERLEFGMESVAILSHTFINSGGNIIPCRTAIVDLGLNEIDPGLAPDGAKCGEGKMCVNQQCLSVESLRVASGACPQNCNGNGICNSKGRCHCKHGFAFPNCDYPGTGGSEDSGPASDPNVRRDMMTALYIIFLGIVPFLALVGLFMYYTRHNVKYWWKKNRRASIPSTKTNGRPNLSKPDSKKPPQVRCISNGNSLITRSDRTNGKNGLEIASPISENVSNQNDGAEASLLPKSDVDSSSSSSPASLQSSLFGHFKGFTITPLPATSPPRPPAPVSPPILPSSAATTQKLPTKTTITASASRVGMPVTTQSATNSIPPSLPTSARPTISSPVLDATTCTAKELAVAPIVPTRPAPSIPTKNSTTHQEGKPQRPISSPNTLSTNMTNSPQLNDDKKIKDSGSSYPTLTRLASFMLRQNSNNPVTRTQSQNQGKKNNSEGTSTLPKAHLKPNKLQLDKESLRNLQISNPIPQKEIEIPQSAVPVLSNGNESKPVVMRAQSVRATAQTQRPAIPTFGSMRQPSGSKRPTSIPAATRPTSPPPRPPPLPSSKPTKMPTYQNPCEYNYNDCLNLISDAAPLANIDEECSPTMHIDNIYAVIEESPPNGNRKAIHSVNEYTSPIPPIKKYEIPGAKIVTKSEYTSPTGNDYQSPKPIENSVNAGSAESLGLLSEIVNEIQARNMESIYSTSSLGRKEKANQIPSEDNVDSTSSKMNSTMPDKNSNISSSNSSVGTYANTPYPTSGIYKPDSSVYCNGSIKPTNSSSSSSSGYLSPSAVSSGPKLSDLHQFSKEQSKTTPAFKGITSNNISKTGVSDSMKQVPSKVSFNIPSSSLSVAKSTTDPKKSNVHKPSANLSSNKPPNPAPQTTGATKSAQATKSSIHATSSTLQKEKTSAKAVTLGNSPDVVSSCAVGTNVNASKSPDVIGSKSNKTEVKSPDVTGSGKLPSKISVSNKNNPSDNLSVNKGNSTKQTSFNNSFRNNRIGKQPQPAPKPAVFKLSGPISATSKGGTKGPAASKPSADETINKSMPAAAKLAGSKSSHVASLQQKFESASEKGTSERTPNVGVKSKPTLTNNLSVGSETGRAVGSKK